MEILKRISRWLVASLLLSTGLTAQAALLDLKLLEPDVSSVVSVDYDGSELFTASGFATSLIAGGTTDDIMGGWFDLTASITGGTLNSGSFSITGTTGTYASGNLLTGDLTGLGYQNGSTILEFLFNPTGGDLAPLYTFGSGQGGIIMTFSGYTGTDFDTPFNTSLATSVDVAPVPVPAAVWLFGSGLLAFAGIARRRTWAVKS